MYNLKKQDVIGAGLMQDSNDIDQETTGHPDFDLVAIAAEIQTLKKRRTMDSILQSGCTDCGITLIFPFEMQSVICNWQKRIQIRHWCQICPPQRHCYY